MIYGIGTDILQVSRVAAALTRHGERFAERILGTEELFEYHTRKARAEVRGLRFLATRFAAKEAFSKAIGLGMQLPMAWRAVQILNMPSGKPTLVANGSLLAFMNRHGLSTQVTMTDEAGYAVAFVIVEQKTA